MRKDNGGALARKATAGQDGQDQQLSCLRPSSPPPTLSSPLGAFSYDVSSPCPLTSAVMAAFSCWCRDAMMMVSSSRWSASLDFAST
jgi:hypothetical protein